MLNLFRDSVQRFRTVNLKELVIDRISHHGWSIHR
jgi:hypothetical protein